MNQKYSGDCLSKQGGGGSQNLQNPVYVAQYTILPIPLPTITNTIMVMVW